MTAETTAKTAGLVEGRGRGPVLSCEKVSHWFGTHGVLKDVDMTVQRGSIVSIVGPSGCGKSTLLRALVGTHPPRAGSIRVFTGDDGTGKTVTRPGRDRGIVYQRYSLMPFLRARENVALGLVMDRTSLPFRLFSPLKARTRKKAMLEEADAMLERVGLAHARFSYPSEMSGGMCQRVAIAQTMIMKPEIMLLDEPFGALDEATRRDLQTMLLELYKENTEAMGRGEAPMHTILIVTHELNEAIYVGDRVVGLSQFWDWKAAGHDKCPGATIVYDEPAPVFDPDSEPDFLAFARQKSDIRTRVFEAPENRSAK